MDNDLPKFQFDVPGYSVPLTLVVDKAANVLLIGEKSRKQFAVPIGWLYLQVCKRAAGK